MVGRTSCDERVDDRGRYMLIMFVCDIGLAPPQASTELGARSGILGIIDGMAGITQDDFNEDYAERVVEKVATAIRLFFTNLQDGSVDEDEVARFYRKVRLVAADDRQRYLLIMFVCDIGLAPPQANTKLGAMQFELQLKTLWCEQTQSLAPPQATLD